MGGSRRLEAPTYQELETFHALAVTMSRFCMGQGSLGSFTCYLPQDLPFDNLVLQPLGSTVIASSSDKVTMVTAKHALGH